MWAAQYHMHGALRKTVMLLITPELLRDQITKEKSVAKGRHLFPDPEKFVSNLETDPSKFKVVLL